MKPVQLFWLFLGFFSTWKCVEGQLAPPGDLFSIEWRWIYQDDLYMYAMDPAGAEYGERLYLARGKSPKGNWMSGKLLVRDETVIKMGNNGEEITETFFQVLIAPQGSLSWIPMPQNGSIPLGSIVSGVSDNTEKKLFVCRGNDGNGNIIPGKYAPNRKKCYVATQEKELGLGRGEVLVTNAYADAVAIENKTDEEAQIKDNSDPPPREQKHRRPNPRRKVIVDSKVNKPV